MFIASPNEKNLVRAYAKALASAMDGSVEKILQTMRAIFSSLRPKITINAEGKGQMISTQWRGRPSG